MPDTQFEARNKHDSKRGEGIATIWLILYLIGFLDIFVFKTSTVKLALNSPETHSISLLNHR